MTQDPSNNLRELEEWLRASVADAGSRLPELLDLPAAVLRRELEADAGLRTPGMLKLLTAAAHDAVDRFPKRAYELTSIITTLRVTPETSPSRVPVLRRLKALAWKEHASAAIEVGRIDEARDALAAARDLLLITPANDWYVATVDLVEAPLVHDDGDPEEALRLLRRAASEFESHHDYENLVQARMLEMSMLWNAGEYDAAAEIWTETSALAQRRGDRTLLARLHSKAGLFQLRHGHADAAARLLTDAVKLFDEAGLVLEGIRARWQLAEAAAERGRIHEAISEFYKVRAKLLGIGAVNDAAIASAEIVELLLVADRIAEVAPLTEAFVETFRRQLTQNALEAFTYLHARAAAGTLTSEDTAAVRRFFEDLPQQPRARFRGVE